jgi:putative ABC transport system permease protein
MLVLATRMLLGEPMRWAGVVLGVFFCTFLITHLLSMFAGMMQRSYALVSDIPHADVWVMDPAVEYVDEPAGMPATALDRVRSVEGVAWAVPLATTTLRARLSSGKNVGVLLIGVDDATLLGAPEDVVVGSVHDLRRDDAIIIDAESAAGQFRLPVQPHAEEPGWRHPVLDGPTRPMRVGDELSLNDHRCVVLGLARLTPRFMSRPTAYTTYSRAVAITPRQRTMLSFVLARVGTGHDPREVARHIGERTGLRARARLDFAEDTVWYYTRTTGVVARMAFMVGIGVMVGVSISALLLFLFTLDNARFYVTFKALGASARVLVAMIATQAAACGVTGFGLGVGASSLIGSVVEINAMPYLLMWQTLAFTAVAVVVVCVVAAVLSARLVLRLDPSRVFAQ